MATTDSVGETRMAISEAEYLSGLWERNIDANCHGAVPEGKRVGSGRKPDGGFCSGRCYASYHALELAEKANLLRRGASPSNEC
jgi:hypothetical protein